MHNGDRNVEILRSICKIEKYANRNYLSRLCTLIRKAGASKVSTRFKTFFHAQLNRTWNLIAHRNIKGENKISCFKTII